MKYSWLRSLQDESGHRIGLRFRGARLVLAFAAGGAVVSLTAAASAQTKRTCASLASDGTLPNPVYGNGGSAITADLKLVAIALAHQNPPVNIRYSDGGGACVQFQNFVGQWASAAPTTVKTDFHYWTKDGTEADGTPPLAGQATVGSHMDNAADPCQGLTVPSGVKDSTAP